MSTIYTVEGNTSGGSTLVANGGSVAKKSYSSTYANIAKIWRPKYNSGEAAKVAQEALKYVGYLEKKSNSQLEDFTANAGSANYNMFATHAAQATGATNIYVNGVAWCDIFSDDMFIRALGTTRAKQLLYGWSAYTPTSSTYLQKAGATEITDFSKATYGDVIFFKNASGICHVGIVVTNVPGTASTSSSTSATSTSSSATSVNYKVKINTPSGVNVRKGAGTNYSKISAIANGVTVTITKEQNGWGYVSEYSGWITLQYTTKVTSSTTSSSTASTTSSSSSYTVGKTYTLQAEMKVRTGAGTNYRAKTHSELTSDGQKHDVDKDGCLDKGTVITCQEVKNVGSDIWVRCPSGWIAAKYQGKVYIK